MADPEVKPNPPAPAASKADASKTPPTPDKKDVDNRPEPDQVRSTKAEDDLRARDPDTVESANLASPVDGKMMASDHLAQKFGNVPANPKQAPHIDPDYDGPLTRLALKTPDKPEGVVVDVHPDMVGDYLRAGYHQA